MKRNKAIEWLLGEDTGVSSKTMCAGVLGIDLGHLADKPYDIYDLGRCVRFCRYVGITDADLRKICKTYPWWEPLYQNWGRLTYLYDHNNGHEAYDLLHTIKGRYYETDKSEIVVQVAARV